MVGDAIPSVVEMGEIAAYGIVVAHKIGVDVASDVFIACGDSGKAGLDGDAVNGMFIARFPIDMPTVVGPVFGTAFGGVVTEDVACGEEPDEPLRLEADVDGLAHRTRGAMLSIDGSNDGADEIFAVVVVVAVVVDDVDGGFFFGQAITEKAVGKLGEIGFPLLALDDIGHFCIGLLGSTLVYALVVGVEFAVRVLLALSASLNARSVCWPCCADVAK